VAARREAGIIGGVSAATTGEEVRTVCTEPHEMPHAPFARDTRSLRTRALYGFLTMAVACGGPCLFLAWARAPMAGIAVIAAAMFALPAWRAVRAAAIHRRIAKGRRLRPAEPWTWDLPWDPTSLVPVVSRSRQGHGYHDWISSVLGGIVMGVGVAIGFAGGAVGVVPGLLVGAVGTIVLWSGVRSLRAGHVQISSLRFPVFVGERIEFSLGVSEGGARFERATALLRCGEQIVGRRPKVRHVWSETIELAADSLPGPGHETLLRFDVPPDLRGTRLDVPDACCWELVVSGRTDRGQVSESFLVPIYERPAPHSAA